MNEALERAIDEVGRDRVFARARLYGWSAENCPPEWVWLGIVQELRSGIQPSLNPLPKASDDVFDFLWRLLAT